MMTLREAKNEDVPALQKLNQEAFVDNLAYDPDISVDWAMSEEGKAHFTDIFGNPDSGCFVADDAGVLVGYIVLSKRDVDYRKSRCVEIVDLGVTSRYQSKGIGTLLIQKTKEWAKEKGYQKMYVSCYFHNTRGVAFYKKNGLTELDLDLEMDL